MLATWFEKEEHEKKLVTAVALCAGATPLLSIRKQIGHVREKRQERGIQHISHSLVDALIAHGGLFCCFSFPMAVKSFWSFVVGKKLQGDKIPGIFTNRASTVGFNYCVLV